MSLVDGIDVHETAMKAAVKDAVYEYGGQKEPDLIVSRRVNDPDERTQYPIGKDNVRIVPITTGSLTRQMKWPS